MESIYFNGLTMNMFSFTNYVQKNRGSIDLREPHKWLSMWNISQRRRGAHIKHLISELLFEQFILTITHRLVTSSISCNDNRSRGTSEVLENRGVIKPGACRRFVHHRADKMVRLTTRNACSLVSILVLIGIGQAFVLQTDDGIKGIFKFSFTLIVKQMHFSLDTCKGIHSFIHLFKQYVKVD